MPQTPDRDERGHPTVPSSRAPAHRKRDQKTPVWVDGIALPDALFVLATNESVFAIADGIPPADKSRGGHPGDYQMWVYVVFNSLIGYCGSASQAARELSNEHNWKLLLGFVAQYQGEERVLGLPPYGPRRHHWSHAAKIVKPYLADIEATFLREAVTQAIEQGCFEPGKFSLKNAKRGNFVIGDGKVFSPMCRAMSEYDVDPDTGEVLRRNRIDPAAAEHTEISTEERRAVKVFGSKHVSVSVRADNSPLTRVALTRSWQPKRGRGGEPGIGMDLLDVVHAEVTRQGGQMDGSVWDGAMSGKHHDRALANGYALISPSKAQSNPGGRSYLTKGRVSKDHNLGEKRYANCVHQIHAVDGAPHETEDSEDGLIFTPLWFETERHARKTTGPAWYHEIRIPCQHGDKTIDGQRFHVTRIPLRQQPEDTAAGFNRPENLRAVPNGTAIYDATYHAWRPDAESKNNQDEHAFHLYRLPALGEQQQRLILMGLDLMQNSIARAITRGTLRSRADRAREWRAKQRQAA